MSAKQCVNCQIALPHSTHTIAEKVIAIKICQKNILHEISHFFFTPIFKMSNKLHLEAIDY